MSTKWTFKLHISHVNVVQLAVSRTLRQAVSVTTSEGAGLPLRHSISQLFKTVQITC